jgi:hypothetical protein
MSCSVSNWQHHKVDHKHKETRGAVALNSAQMFSSPLSARPADVYRTVPAALCTGLAQEDASGAVSPRGMTQLGSVTAVMGSAGPPKEE